MTYFSEKYLDFFSELSENNNREWFHAHKEVYEKEVKGPFHHFVSVLIDHLSADYPDITPTPSSCIFRINRDIRFAKDKSPYKLNMAALIGPAGTRERNWPSFYVQFGIEEILIGGGVYFADKEQIRKIRQEIYYQPDEFKKTIENPDFIRSFGEIQGEKNKIIHPEFSQFRVVQPLIGNKQWWFYRKLSKSDIIQDDLERKVLTHFKHAAPLQQFLIQALHT